MFEEYNAYGAVHYGNMGRKIAIYNTKLKKSMAVTDEKQAQKAIVLVHPYLANDHEKKQLLERAREENLQIQASISEPVAAVLYYTAQNPAINKVGRVRVINLHQDKVDISFVRVAKEKIEVESHHSLFMGSRILLEKMIDVYTRKLRAMDRDVLNYAKEKIQLRVCAKNAMFRLTSNRLLEDKFIFESLQTGKSYEVNLMRFEFDQLVSQTAKEILKKIELIDQSCHGTILCGGLCEYETLIDEVRATYRDAPVSAYKTHEAEVLGAAYYAKQVKEHQKQTGRG